MTFVESAAVHCILLRLAIEVISFCVDTVVSKETFNLSVLKGQFLNSLLHAHQRSELLSNRLAVKDVNGSFTTWAAHEAEAHSEGWVS